MTLVFVVADDLLLCHDPDPSNSRLRRMTDKRIVCDRAPEICMLILFARHRSNHEETARIKQRGLGSEVLD